ncbi:MAG: histidine kinase [Burkholderiales bacterium]|nr:histidine kinase [Burkholderiales bacterium]MDE2276234.1 histidine kinase [Burkholderiales bacterium]
MNSSRGLPQLLLVEPDFLLRRTVASVARELGLAQVQEATSLDRAALELARVPFDAILVSLDPEGEALKYLEGLRRGNCLSDSATPVAVTADGCDAGLAMRLRELDVRRLLLKPFKVKGVVETIAGLCADAKALA